jgi:hypothetical protein
MGQNYNSPGQRVLSYQWRCQHRKARPHGFMTGTLQAFARQFGTSVDVLGIAFKVLDVSLEDIHASPPAGVYIHGLFMDSCRCAVTESFGLDTLHPGWPIPAALFCTTVGIE